MFYNYIFKNIKNKNLPHINKIIEKDKKQECKNCRFA